MSRTLPVASPVEERALRFGRGNALVGILSGPSEPKAEPSRAAILILGAGIIHKVGPSRVSVELARALAGQGHTVLRFDLAGIGDSDRSAGGSLELSVRADIRDAVTTLLGARDAEGVVTVGYCSGADNGFFVADEDPRIRGVVMFDPTVHPTRGFHQRRLAGRVTSARSWMNVLSGRSVYLRVKRSVTATGSLRPPGYYGLLSTGPEETDARAGRLVARNVRLLYCLSEGCQSYCNAPEQIRESLPNAYSSEHMTVEWLPELDHILSDPAARRGFIELVSRWLARWFP